MQYGSTGDLFSFTYHGVGVRRGEVWRWVGGTEAKSGTVAIPGLIDFHYESLLIYDFMAYKKGP